MPIRRKTYLRKLASTTLSKVNNIGINYEVSNLRKCVFMYFSAEIFLLFSITKIQTRIL